MPSLVAVMDLFQRLRRCDLVPAALAPALVVLVAACAPVANGQPAPTGAAAPMPASELHDRRDLPGAGAVAFDPTGKRLVWASGEDVRVLELDSGAQAVRASGGWIDDLGFAPDGSLWVVGDKVQRWQGDALACSTPGVDADRLLAADAQGAVVAGYEHSDGEGMLRHQVWLDPDCHQSMESTQPLPKEVTNAEADPGAPLGRASLQPPRPRVDQALLRPLDGMPGAKLVAVSADGRWWVVDAGGRRSLWRAEGR